MYILGISAYYHDSAACLFRNGTLLGAAEEERFTGIKGDKSFPKETIDWLLRSNGIKISDVSTVCWYENPDLKRDRVLKTFRRNPIKNWKRIIKHFTWGNFPKLWKILNEEIGFFGKIHIVDHHLSHASLAYFTSYFEECNIVTVDGVGEHETITISKASQNKITKLASINYPHSLGLFYSAFTAYLGFKPNEGEYKLMGLAAYGDPDIYKERIKRTISFKEGELYVDMKYFSWDYSDEIMFNENLCELLEISPRISTDPLDDQYKHIAASVQKIYEEILFEVLNHSYELNRSSNLCLGGGCAYNGVANAGIQKNTPYKKVWIPLSPSDSGSAIGACLNYINVKRGQKRKGSFEAYQGPSFGINEIRSSLLKHGNKIDWEHMETSALIKKSANLLNEGNVFGWFQGKMEFGARALGNRSILASPIFPGMQDRINSVIKKRELFRPFAPSVTLDKANIYFELDSPVPYMNMVVKVKPGWNLPAITHVDGTARVQTVTSFENPRYHRLLKEMEELSGYPILLNTSFNFKDQTITLYPEDAIIRFLDSEMDYLVLGNFFVSKK
jgi:carbamoyltransferase